MSYHTTFTLFPKLPTELRLMIWRAARPGPRTIELKWRNDIGRWTSIAKPPVILQVNAESREEALKHYQLWFDGTSVPSEDGGKYSRNANLPMRTIYFDNRIDTAYLSTNTFDPATTHSLFAEGSYDFFLIKSLAMDLTYFLTYYGLPDPLPIQLIPPAWPQNSWLLDGSSIFQLLGSRLEKLRVIRDIRSYNPENMVLDSAARWQIERCAMAEVWEVLQLYSTGASLLWSSSPSLEYWKCKGLLVDGCPILERITGGAAWTNEIYVGEG